MTHTILPVLDLMNGAIVRGVAGRRDHYRPIVSTLVDSAEPLALARAFRDHFGFTEHYLADLDAIQQGPVAANVYAALWDDGFRLWLDAGVRSAQDEVLEMLLGHETTSVIVGLESVAGPEELRRIIGRVGAERSVFSLDLKNGVPLGTLERWSTADPREIAGHAIEQLGVRRLIVLDLANVGVGAGVSTEELCGRLKNAYPNVQLTAGGGVRGIDDVKRLIGAGVDRVLVASALHDGWITPGDLVV